MIPKGLKEAYHNFWNKFDALLDQVAKKDPHLIKYKHLQLSLTSDGKLQISIGTLYDKIEITLFFGLFLSLFSFGNIINMERHAPSEFFLGWKFLTAAAVYILILFYNWTQGYVVFDRKKETIWIKVYAHKFLGEKLIGFQDVKGWHVNTVNHKSNSCTQYKKHHFLLKLHTGKSISLFSINKDSDGDDSKEQIEQYLGRTLTPLRNKERKW